MIDSVLFDLDGTLWDATPGITAVWNQVLHENGYDYRLTRSEICSYMGMPLIDICRAILPEASDAEQQHIFSLLSAAETKCCSGLGSGYEDAVRLYDGVRETLEHLSHTRSLLIVSNCGVGYIEGFLKTFGLQKLFLDFESHGGTGQPKSYNIREIVRRNNLRHPVYVGDTQGDERSAGDAGVPFIHAAYGFGQALEPAGILRDFRELPRLLETLDFTLNP